jgi:hypothetical protein
MSTYAECIFPSGENSIAVHSFLSSSAMISGILLGELVPFLGALRILGWFPARLDPMTGKYKTFLHPIDVAYCIAVNSFVVIAHFPTLYYGFQVQILIANSILSSACCFLQAILRTEGYFPLFTYGQTFGTVSSAFAPILFAIQTRSTVESLNGLIEIQVNPIFTIKVRLICMNTFSAVGSKYGRSNWHKINVFNCWFCSYAFSGTISTEFCERGDRFALHSRQSKYRPTFQHWHELCEWNFDHILVADDLLSYFSHCEATISTT